MLKRVSNFILTCLLLIGTVSCSVRPAGAWYCEGKQCGINLWSCCCTSSSSLQDRKCRDTTSAPSDGRSAMCAAGCRCAMVMTNVPDCDHAPPPAVVPFEPLVAIAILPAPVVTYVAPVLTELTSYRIDSRGPPSQWVTRATPCLRGPPAA